LKPLPIATTQTVIADPMVTLPRAIVAAYDYADYHDERWTWPFPRGTEANIGYSNR
jgi:hypothetical protein